MADKRTRHIVRKMPVAPHNALLQCPGVRPHLQHFQIVVSFQQQHIRAAQMKTNRLRHVAQVRGDGDLDAFGAERKPNRIGCIVRNSETGDVDIADGKR